MTGPDGLVLFTGDDVREGQQVFLKYGLMDNGTIWGHGAMLGPDFSAEYLHTLALHGAASLAQQRYSLTPDKLTAAQRAAVEAEVRTELKLNRYDPKSDVLTGAPLLETGSETSPGCGRSAFPLRQETVDSAPIPSVISQS